MSAGIIVVAAGDRRVLAQPFVTADVATALMLLGGSALFLAGHALFKLAVFRHWSWTRIGAIVVLGLLIPIGLRVPALGVSGFAVAVVAVVVILDRFHKATDITLSPSMAAVPSPETGGRV